MSVRLAMWNHTKQQKGFGYVEFEKEAGADSDAKKSGMKVHGFLLVSLTIDLYVV